MTNLRWIFTPGTPATREQASQSIQRAQGHHVYFIIDTLALIFAKEPGISKQRLISLTLELLNIARCDVTIVHVFEGLISLFKEAVRHEAGRDSDFTVLQALVKWLQTHGILTEDLQSFDVDSGLFSQAVRARYMTDCMDKLYATIAPLSAQYPNATVVSLLATTEGEQQTTQLLKECIELRNSPTNNIAHAVGVVHDGDSLATAIGLKLDCDLWRMIKVRSGAGQEFCKILNVRQAASSFVSNLYQPRLDLFIEYSHAYPCNAVGARSDSKPGGHRGYAEGAFQDTNKELVDTLPLPGEPGAVDADDIDAVLEAVVDAAIRVDPTRDAETLSNVMAIGHAGLFGPVVVGIMPVIHRFSLQGHPLGTNINSGTFTNVKLGVQRLAPSPSSQSHNWQRVDRLYEKAAREGVVMRVLCGEATLVLDVSVEEALRRIPTDNFQQLQELLEYATTSYLRNRTVKKARTNQKEVVLELFDVFRAVCEGGALFCIGLHQSHIINGIVLPREGSRFLIDALTGRKLVGAVEAANKKLLGTPPDASSGGQDLNLVALIKHQDFDSHRQLYHSEPAVLLSYKRRAQGTQTGTEQPGFTSTGALTQLLDAKSRDVFAVGFMRHPHEGPPLLGVSISPAVHVNGQLQLPFHGLVHYDSTLRDEYNSMKDRLIEYNDAADDAMDHEELLAASEGITASFASLAAAIDGHLVKQLKLGKAAKASIEAINQTRINSDNDEVSSNSAIFSFPSSALGNSPASLDNAIRWMTDASMPEVAKLSEMMRNCPCSPGVVRKSLTFMLQAPGFISRYLPIKAYFAAPQNDPSKASSSRAPSNPNTVTAVRIRMLYGMQGSVEREQKSNDTLDVLEQVLSHHRCPAIPLDIMQAVFANGFDADFDALSLSERKQNSTRHIRFGESEEARKQYALATVNELAETGVISSIARKSTTPLDYKEVSDSITALIGTPEERIKDGLAKGRQKTVQGKKEKGNALSIDYTNLEEVTMMADVIAFTTDGAQFEKNHAIRCEALGLTNYNLRTAEAFFLQLLNDPNRCPSSIRDNEKVLERFTSTATNSNALRSRENAIEACIEKVVIYQQDPNSLKPEERSIIGKLSWEPKRLNSLSDEERALVQAAKTAAQKKSTKAGWPFTNATGPWWTVVKDAIVKAGGLKKLVNMVDRCVQAVLAENPKADKVKDKVVARIGKTQELDQLQRRFLTEINKCDENTAGAPATNALQQLGARRSFYEPLVDKFLQHFRGTANESKRKDMLARVCLKFWRRSQAGADIKWENGWIAAEVRAMQEKLGVGMEVFEPPST